MATWHDTTSIKAVWGNAPAGTPLEDLLEVSKSQILARGTLSGYVPADADADPDPIAEVVPIQYRVAQGLYARALWESQKATAGDADVIGGEYQVRVYPMSSTILDLIAPKIPRVG